MSTADPCGLAFVALDSGEPSRAVVARHAAAAAISGQLAQLDNLVMAFDQTGGRLELLRWLCDAIDSGHLTLCVQAPPPRSGSWAGSRKPEADMRLRLPNPARAGQAGRAGPAGGNSC